MHNGPLVFLRMYMFYAKPWQQLAICGVFIAFGVTLIALMGQPAGIIPIVFGVGAGLPILSLRFRPNARSARGFHNDRR